MLLFFDIDGTIFDDQRNLPASVKPALEEARKNGHRLIINTGRTLCNMDHRLDDFPIDGWIMGCGTKVIYHGDTLRRMEHNLQESLQLRSVFLKLEIPVVYECDTAMYFDPMVRSNTAIGGFREFAERHSIARDIDEEDTEFRIVKMFCFAKQEKIQELKEQTEEIGIPYDAIGRRPDAWEIVPKGYSKGDGIEYLRNHLGYQKNDCYAFGDSRNDLTMFQHVGQGIAMGNATDDVKRACSYVTDRPENDGIAKAMIYFGLIQENFEYDSVPRHLR